jgi:hypothetical protein
MTNKESAMSKLGRRFEMCLVMVLTSICVAQEHRGIVLDATTSHIIVTGGMTPANIAAGKRDPRIMQLLLRQARIQEQRGPSSGIPALDGFGVSDATVAATAIKVEGKTTQVAANRKIDWSVNLGAGNLAPHEYAAKYGFNLNAQPDCVNDYAVYGLNITGVTGGQANLVGINELYSGSNPTGLCGTEPHVNWAYNGSTAGGVILGSTTLSLDGTKIAYVESAASSSILHVLTWKAGQGTSAVHAAKPTSVGSCSATTSCLTSLTYSSASTTNADGVYVNYDSDKGYVASNDGKIYQISCVFLCALNANPTVDWVFDLPVAGTGGALPVPSFLPVYDAGFVFVGDQLGEVWSINASGSTPVLAAGPVMVGGGGCTAANPPGRTGTPSPCTANGDSYGVGGPVIDGTAEKVYAYSGNDGTPGASAVVVQMNFDLTGQVRDTVGLGSVGNTTTNVNLDIGAFDYNYEFGEPTEGHLFLCGTGTSDTTPYDYWIGFADYPVMNSQPTKGLQRIAVAGAPCTGYTELYNPSLNLGGNANDHDLLMSGVIDPTDGVLITDDISDGSITGPLNFVFYPGGTSNFIIDNTSDEPQASNMYFSTLAVVSVGSCSNARCAVKLSQLDLQ